MTADALAAEFEVSVRTIYRDIDQLSAAGAPVYADRGRSGGFQLMDGYRTRLTGLTDAEAETLFLGGLSGPAAQMGFSGAVTTMQLKLLAALPPERQAAAERLAGRFHLDPVGWYQTPDEAERLPVIARAVWASHRIRVRYESWKGVSDRVLEPLGLILKGGVWYLAATVADRAPREPAIWRVAAMLALETETIGFERPAGFDLGEWWDRASRRFETERITGEARLRLSAEGRRRFAATGLNAARIVAAIDPDAGWTEVVVPIESIAHATGDFLRLGSEVEVLAPSDLREAMRDAVTGMVALYDDAPAE